MEEWQAWIVKCPQCKTKLWQWEGRERPQSFNFRDPQYLKLPQLFPAQEKDTKFYWCGCKHNQYFDLERGPKFFPYLRLL